MIKKAVCPGFPRLLRPACGALVGLVLLFGSPAGRAAPGNSAHLWLGPDGELLPFSGYEAAEQFLLNAKVVGRKRVGKGVNNPWKVLLELDGVRAHAIFRDVDVNKRKARFRDGRRQDHFRDCAMFEVAAYRLARLLKLDGIPPTVDRSLAGNRGSLQLWIEEAMTEKARVEAGWAPTDYAAWRTYMQHLRFFDNLISNSDRNQGNLLLDSAGRLWMIDHTRAFRRNRELHSGTSFYQMERRVWDRLLNADRKEWERQLGDYLHRQELAGLWHRRSLIVERFQQLIEERGEHLVLLDPVQPGLVLASR